MNNTPTVYSNEGEESTIDRSAFAKPNPSAASATTKFMTELKTETDHRTVLISKQAHDICVGWVVAILGPLKGKSFPLHMGQNHLGNEIRNDIIISKSIDDGISTFNHINIEYDHIENAYYVSRGNEGHSLAYINGKRLSGGQEKQLKHGDSIKLSKKTTIRFIPFCDSTFNWEEPENKSENKSEIEPRKDA